MVIAGYIAGRKHRPAVPLSRLWIVEQEKVVIEDREAMEEGEGRLD